MRTPQPKAAEALASEAAERPPQLKLNLRVNTHPKPAAGKPQLHKRLP